MRGNFLKVLPNPWLHLNENAEPCAVVAVDPTVNPNRAFVGASVKSTEVLDNYPKHYFLSPRQYTTWEFSKEPVSIEFSAYYRDLVKDNILVAEDEASAKKCGISFTDPKRILNDAKVAAAKNWFAAYGYYPDWYEEPVKQVSNPAVVESVKK